MPYIAFLRSLIVTCDFGNMADEMIRNQLIEKTTNLRVRERLLLEPQQAVTLQKSSLSLQTNDYKRKTNGKTQNQQIQNTVKACFCYGSPQHLAGYTRWLAKVAQCNHCKKMGHFAKVCHSSQFNQQVHAVTIPDITVLSMDKITTAHIPEQIKCTVNVSTIPSGKPPQLMLDTGPAESILPDSIYLHYFKDVPVTEPKLHLVCYLKNHIPVHGCLPVIVTFGDCCVTAEFYIVHKGTPFLGGDLLAALNLRVVNGRIDLPQQSTLAVHTPVSAGTQHQVEEKLGCAYGFLHKVKMWNNVMPVRQKLRRLPFSVREAVSEELRKLVQKDIIEEIGSSEWVSPTVVTQKKGGGIRLCVDLREPNKAIVIDSHPLPHIEEVFAELRGAKMFPTLDLQSAYHKVMLHEDSRDLTAFITHEGLFCIKHVPYSLASAPGAFQTMMPLILKNQHGVQCYLDDVIVFGNTSEEHDNNLQSVLNCISKAGLKLNRSKCKFRQTELSFLGHTISQAGLKPDPDHILAISNASPPTDLKTLLSFLGLTSWHAKFIPNYASVTEPL
ncbi:unnamed protein product [Lepidochelys kempii]